MRGRAALRKSQLARRSRFHAQHASLHSMISACVKPPLWGFRNVTPVYNAQSGFRPTPEKEVTEH